MTTTSSPAAAKADRLEAGLRRARAWLVPLLLAGLLVALGLRNVYREAADVRGDTQIYRRAAAAFVAGERLARAEPKYLYPPPLAAVSAAWMPWLPYRAVRAVWLVACLAAAAATVRLALRHVVEHGHSRPGVALLLAGPLVVRVGWDDLTHGQVNWPVALLLTWAVTRARTAQGEPRAGVAAAAALVIKPTAWPLVAGWLLERRWRAALACAGAGLLFLALPALRWGAAYPDVLRDWLGVLADFARRAASAKGNVSLPAALVHGLSGWTLGESGLAADPLVPLALALPLDQVLPWARAAGALAALGGVAALWRWRRDDPRAGAALLALGALASPVSWKPHLVVLVLPALWAVRGLADGRAGRRAWLGWALVTLFLGLPTGALGLEAPAALGGFALAIGLVGLGAVAGPLVASDAAAGSSTPT